ncbi:MAG: S-methyl-5-thioribose-1-phosphate isomerase [Oscillospiraceae bacterium]|nr:S-methyl-5-thioribose-1-phosphate isomerase [Oscillospiraceae bacterium]
MVDIDTDQQVDGIGALPQKWSVENVRFSADGASVVILDQTLLPGETKYLKLNKAQDLHEAIVDMRVRGAPAIGIFAAFAMCVIAGQSKAKDYIEFKADVMKCGDYLNSARPTAVNLSRQIRRMEKHVASMEGLPIYRIIESMRCEAEEIQREDIEMCLAISKYGLTLLHSGDGVLTQCNAGPLATSLYGTALGPILLARERGVDLNVFCCETRPLLQGARLTTYELDTAGIGCTLICDNMASIVMSEGKIDAVFTGCDRVARNGDVANKVGTSGLAILAKHYGVKFYVFCPSSTIDPGSATGDNIEIEQREPEEIKEMFFKSPIAPSRVKCYNPAFDVTDNRLITAIITDKGICEPPYYESLTKFWHPSE